MQTPMMLVACCLSALMSLALVACQKDRPPKPTVEAVGTEGLPAVPSGTQTSVPPANTVFPTAGVANPPATPAVRDNKAMTRAEESAAMPMAGQNNDHSAPAGAASRASGR